MPKPVRNIFGIVFLVLAGLFLSCLSDMAFINEPIWPFKTVIFAAFAVPAIIFLSLGAWCRGFDKFRRDLGFVLLAAVGYTVFGVLSFLCMMKSPEVMKQMPPDFFHMFSDVLSGVVCLSAYVFLGLGLLLMPRKTV